MNLWGILRNARFRNDLADDISYADEPWAQQSWKEAYNARNNPAVANDIAAQQALGLNEHAALAREWFNSEDPLLRIAGRYGMPFMTPLYDLSKTAARSGIPGLEQLGMKYTGKGRVEPGIDSLSAGYKGWLTGMADMLRKR